MPTKKKKKVKGAGGGNNVTCRVLSCQNSNPMSANPRNVTPPSAAELDAWAAPECTTATLRAVLDKRKVFCIPKLTDDAPVGLARAMLREAVLRQTAKYRRLKGAHIVIAWDGQTSTAQCQLSNALCNQGALNSSSWGLLQYDGELGTREKWGAPATLLVSTHAWIDTHPPHDGTSLVAFDNAGVDDNVSDDDDTDKGDATKPMWQARRCARMLRLVRRRLPLDANLNDDVRVFVVERAATAKATAASKKNTSAKKAPKTAASTKKKAAVKATSTNKKSTTKAAVTKKKPVTKKATKKSAAAAPKRKASTAKSSVSSKGVKKQKRK
jgi:hypothetical protein